MGQRGSILVVDDESAPRELLRMILNPMYDVFTAVDGEEALQFLAQEQVDLVTLDLKMPRISGIDVLREIRKIKSDVEVIIISGYGTLRQAQEAIRYGVGDFITKPFNIAEIIAIVNKAIERRQINMKIKNLMQSIRGCYLWGQNDPPGTRANLGESIAAKDSPEELREKLQESLQLWDSLQTQKVDVNYLDFLKVLIYVLESKDPYTSRHSERVSFYSQQIAQDLHFSSQEKEDLQIATLLHDIGKVGLSNRLLAKKDLNETDCNDIQQHPLKGVHLIEPLGFSHAITTAILHHHERWDGKGYPDGLTGEDIPKFARIIALADSYDAMISDRPYRQRLPILRAKEEIKSNAGVQFDPHMTLCFARYIEEGENQDLFPQTANIQ